MNQSQRSSQRELPPFPIFFIYSNYAWPNLTGNKFLQKKDLHFPWTLFANSKTHTHTGRDRERAKNIFAAWCTKYFKLCYEDKSVVDSESSGGRDALRPNISHKDRFLLSAKNCTLKFNFLKLFYLVKKEWKGNKWNFNKIENWKINILWTLKFLTPSCCYLFPFHFCSACKLELTIT